MPRVAEGVVLPIPTFPLASTMKAVVVEREELVEMANIGTVERVAVEVGERLKIAKGEVEARPSLP